MKAVEALTAWSTVVSLPPGISDTKKFPQGSKLSNFFSRIFPFRRCAYTPGSRALTFESRAGIWTQRRFEPDCGRLTNPAKA